MKSALLIFTAAPIFSKNNTILVAVGERTAGCFVLWSWAETPAPPQPPWQSKKHLRFLNSFYGLTCSEQARSKKWRQILVDSYDDPWIVQPLVPNALDPCVTDCPVCSPSVFQQVCWLLLTKPKRKHRRFTVPSLEGGQSLRAMGSQKTVSRSRREYSIGKAQGWGTCGRPSTCKHCKLGTKGISCLWGLRFFSGFPVTSGCMGSRQDSQSHSITMHPGHQWIVMSDSPWISGLYIPLETSSESQGVNSPGPGFRGQTCTLWCPRATGRLC